ncbi:VCBS repeat-containing protein [Puia sp. P3]|uniref:VCBS repeat-containing protein n=1 Tax=Puia sp. P3 TaxID=3423952 RepID=UPI003D6684B2
MKLTTPSVRTAMPVLFAAALLAAAGACAQTPAHPGTQTPIFTRLDPKQTGISFQNTIREDDSVNVMRYEYLYNGAGVGIADLNNDGLSDIFFSGNTGPSKLYRNRGNLSFEDITHKAGVAGNGTWATGVSIADVNGDGLLDIYVCHSGKYTDPANLSNQLFICQEIKDGIPVYKDMAAAYGLDAPGTQSTQAVFFDYDRDGDLDMFLLNHSNHTYNPFLNTRKIRSTPDMRYGNRLFRNDGGHFTDVTLEAGVVNNALNFGLSVTVSDLDGDGWPDIYTTSDYTEKDCYYHNDHNGHFTESLAKSFTHISKYSMGSDIADYNNDGRPDVLTLDMLPEDNHRQKLLKGPDEYDEYHLLIDSGYYHQQMRNMLHLNEGVDAGGNLRFSEIGQLAGISNTDWSWAGLFADFDNDGWKDLFISNGYLRDFTNMDFLKYIVPDAKVQAAKAGRQNFQTYDLVKQMPSNKLNNYLFHNNGDLTFTDVTTGWGLSTPSVSNAAAYADLDNDGDLDLVVCNNNQPAEVYRNDEDRTKKNHWLRLRLTGDGLNTRAFGAKATLETGDGIRQYQELYPVRGYQSTMAPELFFGFSRTASPKTLTVIWPSGKTTRLTDLQPDQILQLAEKDAGQGDPSPAKPAALFTDITEASGLSFHHHENDFVDFKAEVLIPYELSREGPALAKADVNGDGLEDLYLGGAIGQPGALYLQTAEGRFKQSPSQPRDTDSVHEQVNALFFDADNDGDPDLYIVCGGNEYADQSEEYQDLLYINDGKGHFTKAPAGALPPMLSSKLTIAAGDFDHDGDIDLFIGGRGLPGSFPLPSGSYLLRNDGGHFTDVTDQLAPALRLPGMVTAAAWVDLNHDQFPELLLAGDWMPVMLFDNKNGRLTDVSASAGLSGTGGMWASVTPLAGGDLLLGNAGYNGQFRASGREPMRLYVTDIDGNGTIDPLFCYYIKGKSYPMASRDELLDEVTALRKKFIKYGDYADATVEDIVPKDALQNAKLLTCEQLASGILHSAGGGKLDFKPLPVPAQFSKVFAAVSDDFDGDGLADLLIAGNFSRTAHNWDGVTQASACC